MDPTGGRPEVVAAAGVHDRAQPVVGWRYWQLSPDRLLRSVTQKWIEWPPGQPLRARCLEVNHPAPDVDCACGVYGTPDLAGLKEHGLCLFPEAALLLGQVALWGQVVADDAGLRGLNAEDSLRGHDAVGSYRGELGYPVRLSLVADTVADGELGVVLDGLARYQVPVDVTTLDEAVAGASAAMLRFQAMSLKASRTWGDG